MIAAAKKKSLIIKPGEYKPGMLAPKQLISMFQSESRVNIWEGSVRSGKTHVTIVRWIMYIMYAPPGDLLMLGKTYGSLVRNVVRPMHLMVGGAMEFKSSSNRITLWGRTIYCYGAGTIDAVGLIQGMTCAGCLGDEVALWKEEVYKMVLSRMSVAGSKFFGTTNPDAPKHWLKVNVIDRAAELGYSLHTLLIDENPFLPKEYVRQLKKEYTGLWYKRYILSLWAVAEGAIYDFYEDKHPYVIKRSQYPEASYYVIGVDYGTQNPFVAGLYGVNKSSRVKIWKECELWYSGRETGRQKTDAEYFDMLDLWVKEKVPKGKYIKKVYPDPSAKSFIVLLRQKGWPVKDNVDNSVLDGIRNQARLLKSGTYAIGEECQHTRDEYSAFVWDDKAQAKGQDVPVKENDHTKDEERYVLQEEFGGEQFNFEALTIM